MEDHKIIDLYWARSQQAIAESEAKYGPYCRSIARGILDRAEDAEECVNDTWFRAWNAMPPQRPNILSAFFGKLTRNLSLDRWRKERAAKRGGSQVEVALHELEDCLPGKDTPEETLRRKEFRDGLNRFLETLPERERVIFVSRYWYLRSIREISQGTGLSEGSIKTQLCRTRKKLHTFLQKEELL